MWTSSKQLLQPLKPLDTLLKKYLKSEKLHDFKFNFSFVGDEGEIVPDDAQNTSAIFLPFFPAWSENFDQTFETTNESSSKLDIKHELIHPD